MSATSGTLSPATEIVDPGIHLARPIHKVVEITRWRTVTLCLSISLLFGLSFAARNIAGYFYTAGSYNPLVYNAQSIRQVPPPAYAFRPDDVAWDETRAYARWTQEILRGEYLGANAESFQPFVKETLQPSRFWLRDRLGPMSLAALAYLTGSVPSAFAWADFFLPFAAACGVFWLSWTLRPSVHFATLCTTMVCFFSWADLLKATYFMRGADDFTSNLLRTPYPQLSIVLLVALLALLTLVVERPSRGRIIALALVLVLNFYTYFYSWMYCCCWIGATLLVLIAEYLLNNSHLGRRRDRNAMLGIVTALALTLAASFPVWYGVLTRSAATLDSFQRLNGQMTHAPNLRYGALLLFAPLFARKSLDRRHRIFSLSFVFGSALVLNQQVFTGTTIQAGHWSAYFIQPICWIVFLNLLWSYLPAHLPVTLKNGVWAMLVIGLVFNTAKLIKCAAVAADYNQKNPELSQVIDCLNRSQYASFGFLTNDAYLEAVLPAYLRQKPLMAWYMDPFSTPDLRRYQQAGLSALGLKKWSDYSETYRSEETTTAGVPSLELRTDRIVYVMNRHRPISDTVRTHHKSVLLNSDFEVLVPSPATSFGQDPASAKVHR